ncbi:MAG: hypothetical protein AUI14_04265 [Actinobacteria bacterium 13_2_20CM_2_71_6]|nr:MAG: hypothetical protein AUI14_04265 [Actinobacteria bacterium 13_2_20CM_2_71_6]
MFVRGILSGLARKNSWTLAEYAGESDPNGMQRLLTSSRWDVDGVRDDLRQYRATVRRTENVQLGLFLVYATAGRWALVDRELYLPPSWAADAERCRRLGVPDGMRFVPKADLARRMIERLIATGASAAWLAADETFAKDPAFRSWLDGTDLAHLLTVRPRDRIATRRGEAGTAHELTGRLPEGAWRHRYLPGAESSRRSGYDWVRVSLARPAGENPTWERLLLAVRSTADRNLIDYYQCRVLPGTPDHELIRVARVLDGIAVPFRRAKHDLGLDQYQVRRYDAWYRHVTLCMLAGAYLAVTRDAN